MAIPLKYNIRNLMVRKVSTGMTVFVIALVSAIRLVRRPSLYAVGIVVASGVVSIGVTGGDASLAGGCGPVAGRAAGRGLRRTAPDARVVPAVRRAA